MKNISTPMPDEYKKYRVRASARQFGRMDSDERGKREEWAKALNLFVQNMQMFM